MSLLCSTDALYGEGSGCQPSPTDVGPLQSYIVNSLISQVATDSDNDWLGIAVVSVSNGQGIWQYNRYQLPKDVWISFPPNINSTNSLLLNGNDSIRYIPKPNYYWTTSEAPAITVKAWDGSTGNPATSTLMNINTDPYTNTTQSISNPIGLFSTSTVAITATRNDCNGTPNTAIVHDACCICGGTGTGCIGCNSILGSNMKYDSCGECNGNDDTCIGCDFIPLSTSIYASECNKCISNSSLQEISLLFKDCSGTCFGLAVTDDCGICTGGNTNYQYNTNK